MENPVHPGQITYLDGNTGDVVAVSDVQEVPESMRFVETESGLVPVVKVVATIVENERLIQEYGPDDEILRSTKQVRESP